MPRSVNITLINDYSIKSFQLLYKQHSYWKRSHVIFNDHLVHQAVSTEAEHEQLENRRVQEDQIFHQATLVLHHLEMVIFFFINNASTRKQIERTHRGNLESREAEHPGANDELPQSQNIYYPLQCICVPANRLFHLDVKRRLLVLVIDRHEKLNEFKDSINIVLYCINIVFVECAKNKCYRVRKKANLTCYYLTNVQQN